MIILINLPTRLTLSELGKELFSRNFRLSLAKRPEKPLMKTQRLMMPESCLATEIDRWL